MFRYIGVAWNPSSDSESSAATVVRQRLLHHCPAWHRALDAAGLFVFCQARDGRAENRVIALGERGAILGTLFPTRPLAAATSVRALPLHAIDEIDRTGGRALIETHWGSYVLILRGRDTGEVHIVRGPMSTLPCYYATHEGATLIFSSVEDCVALNLIRFSINWARIRAQVSMIDYLNDETGLNEIRTLQGGACLSLLGDGRRLEAYWSPGTARWCGTVDRFERAASSLRRVALACVGSWASEHESVVVMLSGGLDSSIVLAALARAPTAPRIACLNFHSPLLGDERAYARSMAQRLGVDLTERERDPGIDLRVILRCNRTASPVLHVTGWDAEPAAVELANSHGASAIFNGELGDNLFGSSVRHEALVEYLHRYGVRPSFIRVAQDYAVLRRVSVWRALRLAIRQWRAERDSKSWSADRYARDVLNFLPESRLASAESMTAAEAVGDRFVHPWSRETERIPVGKRQLVFALQVVSSTSYESPFTSPEDPPTISPLVSQPLIELALAIPTHLHLYGGLNRALARAAFGGDLSELVLRRGRGKGTPELWLRTLLDRNRSFLRELLLEGILVRERLLDRRKVEQVLSDRMQKSTAALPDIVVQMYIEAWLRRWSDASLCAAA